MYPPAWQNIRNQVSSSNAVFLLLGPNIRRCIHTRTNVKSIINASSGVIKAPKHVYHIILSKAKTMDRLRCIDRIFIMVNF